MSGVRLYLRRAGSQDWETVDLPPAREAGLVGPDWSGASVSLALQWVQRHHDPSLAALLSCRRGICDVCAVRIDGKTVTACTTPVRAGMRIEPAKDRLAQAGLVLDLSLVRRARLDTV